MFFLAPLLLFTAVLFLVDLDKMIALGACAFQFHIPRHNRLRPIRHQQLPLFSEHFQIMRQKTMPRHWPEQRGPG